MEINTVFYWTDSGRRSTTKPFTVVDGGIVIHWSENSSMFIPYSVIERIDQTLSGNDWAPDEKFNKSLAQRMRNLARR